MNNLILIAVSLIILAIITAILVNITITNGFSKFNENYRKYIYLISEKEGLRKIFNNSLNPWHMKVITFQTIRFVIPPIILIIATFTYRIFDIFSIFLVFIAVVVFWYPKYYYKAIAKEREEEWNKIYEFFWLIKMNLQMYSAKQAISNIYNYIKENNPNDKEIIGGFGDFYNNFQEEGIPEIIEKNYNFIIPRELYNIIYEMSLNGVYPAEQLASLEAQVNNINDRYIQNKLATVADRATIIVLPFLFITLLLVIGVPFGNLIVTQL